MSKPYTILENAIMDRYEAGLPREQIAAELNCTPVTVDKIIGYMQIGESDLANGPGRAARGSAALAAAIAHHHPERIRALPASTICSRAFHPTARIRRRSPRVSCARSSSASCTSAATVTRRASTRAACAATTPSAAST